VELVLGDSVAAWTRAGFAVSDGTVDCGVKVRLTGEGGGLHGIVFSSSGDAAAGPLKLPGVDAALVTHTSTEARSHPNSCTRFGEVVLYAQRLDEFVSGLAQAGVTTHRGKPPKAMGDMRLAQYFFGSPRMRLLVAGPADADSDPTKNPPMWMFGRGAGRGSTELTGLLPIVRDMTALRAACEGLGDEKPAVQDGRTIATLRQGAVAGLTGTLAFLSDKPGEHLWDS
jgi:hypothetical protein